MAGNTLTGKPAHRAIARFARETRAGLMDRRTFLSHATALGLTAPAALSMAGAPRPARAAGHMAAGGTLRIQHDVLDLPEPRLYAWSQHGNISRGWLEHLISYNRDGTFTPVLLDGWEINEDGTEYRLMLKQGVKWNNGDDLTAAHVAANFEYWCDDTAAGNSMATRLGPLVDPGTGGPVAGGISTEGDHTVILRLPSPDITIIAGIADYPSCLLHPASFGKNAIEAPIGTGPYLPESYEPGTRASVVRNPGHTWWNAGNGAALDRIEFIDLGTDPAGMIAALEAGEIDMTYETVADFVTIVDGLGLTRSEVETAATLVTRPNQLFEADGARPYADVRVRRALQMAVDNGIVLELGYAGLGTVAENHHVSPIHPEYAELPPQTVDPDAALALMTEAGMEGFEHTLYSLDDGFERDTTDAVAAQLRDAGFTVTRVVRPGGDYWADWRTYSFSTTAWNHRPLGIQALALAYRSGSPWNETGFDNPEFDRLLTEASGIVDADTRRGHAAQLQKIMQDEGVVIQSYWRRIFRHFREGLLGADLHPQFEIKYQNMGWSA